MQYLLTSGENHSVSRGEDVGSESLEMSTVVDMEYQLCAGGSHLAALAHPTHSPMQVGVFISLLQRTKPKLKAAERLPLDPIARKALRFKCSCPDAGPLPCPGPISQITPGTGPCLTHQSYGCSSILLSNLLRNRCFFFFSVLSLCNLNILLFN